MSHIHSKNTKPEVFVRKTLWALGFRYRVNVSSLPGKPDIVFPKYKTVVFINGCFWHGHAGCRKFTIPETNKEFWLDKISANIHRDEANTLKLQELGWNVITVWECELSTKEKREQTITRISGILNNLSDKN